MERYNAKIEKIKALAISLVLYLNGQPSQCKKCAFNGVRLKIAQLSFNKSIWASKCCSKLPYITNT